MQKLGDINPQKIPVDKPLSKPVSDPGVQDSQQAKATPTSETPSYVRLLNSKDISDALVKLQKTVTPQNKQILTTMLLYGVETSQEAFELIEKMVKGSDKGNKLESSVIAYSKGLEGNPKAVDIISKFLSHNVQFSGSLASLSQGLQGLKQSLPGYASFLDPSLIAGIAGFLDDFIEDTKLLKKHADNLDIKELIQKQSSLVQDLRYLQDFLKGIGKKLDASNNLMANTLKEAIQMLDKDSRVFHDVLLTQLILSKNPANQLIAEEFFHYFMIPNPMATAQKDLELMIS